jgi:uncharacterized damage-inducible protein DinB
MEQLLNHQYELVKHSRKILLDYCSKIKSDDLINDVEGFGRGSIRNLLVHIMNTYQYWLGSFGLKKNDPFLEAEKIMTVDEIKNKFEKTNLLVSEFLQKFSDNLNVKINGEIRGKEKSLTPLELFTHVITHEYHHKGQILSMSRHLGYTPVDTDVIQ